MPPKSEIPKRLKKSRECGTTHCLAGWAVVLAGKDGLVLEKLLGTPDAAAAIFVKSTGHVPNFYQPLEEEALKGLKRSIAAKKRRDTRRRALKRTPGSLKKRATKKR